MDKAVKVSHAFIWLSIFLIGWLQLATPFLTILFSYLALKHLRIKGSKIVSITLFILLVAAIFQGFVISLQHAYRTLPEIINEALPRLTEMADSYGIALPFSDFHGTKEAALDALSKELGYLTNFAKIATKEFAFLIIGIVVAISMFGVNRISMGDLPGTPANNFYTVLTEQIRARFGIFFKSFETVLGAQLIISVVNTVFTLIFLLAAGIQYAPLLAIITLLCGILPIIGNLISNTAITAVALTQSPKLAFASLIFLIALHKGEYFLNSKIIGSRIKNPMWMTLLGLVIGERLAGIPGMILAPVLLHYLKVETSRVVVNTEESHSMVIR